MLTVNTPAPAVSAAVETPEGWQEYSSELGYKIYYPSDLTAEKNGDYSLTIFKKPDQPTAGLSNFIYVSFFPENQDTNVG